MTAAQQAADAAYRVLLAQSVRTLPVDPLALLRRCRDTQVLTYYEASEQLGMTAERFERLFGAADAFTLRQGEKHIVIYRAGGNPARLRFTLAHELGHRILGPDERQADVFASHLLCPRPVIERLGSMTAERLAAMCYVSLGCAQRVLRQGEQVDRELAQQVERSIPGWKQPNDLGLGGEKHTDQKRNGGILV